MRTAEKSENRTQTKTIISEITKMLLFFAAGFLLARTVAAEKFSPFSLSLCAASPGAYIIPAALGAALGTVTMSGSVSAATYLIAAVLAAASRLIADKIMGKTTAVSASAIGFCSLLAARTAVMIYTGFEAVPYVLYAFEAIFAAAVAYFFFLAFEAAKSELTLSLYSQKQTTAVLISVSVLLCALSSVTVFGVSVARTVAAAVIICAARYGGESNGAISGTAFGIAMSVTNPDYLFLCGGYGFGGLMAGAFSRLGSAFAAGAFAVSNGIFALLCEDTDTALITLYEVMFSCVLFLMLPKGVKKRLSGFFSPRVKTLDFDSSKRILSSRLNRASNALQQMSDTVSRVGEILKDIGGGEFDNVFEKVKKEACEDCMLRAYCWENAKGDTLAELLSAAKNLRSGGEEILSNGFTARCARPKRVEKTLSAAFYEYVSKENAKERVSQVQTAMKLQFDSVSELLTKMGGEIISTESFDRQTAAAAEAVLRNLSLHPLDVSCRREKNGRIYLEMSVSDTVIPQKKLCCELTNICERELEILNVQREGGETLISFSDRAVYSVEFSAKQYINGEYTVCGDAYESFYDSKGCFSALLSDGMGSGKSAAVDGTLAVGLMSRLIRAGFSHSSALSLVNSALLFKGGEESLATLDVARVDLFSGAASFYKAGTPPTYVRRAGRVGTAPCSALPAGILPEIAFEESECTLSDGDIIVMVSDGATADGDEWIKSEIRNFDGSAESLADEILNSAVKRFGAHEDDVTVLVSKLKRT